MLIGAHVSTAGGLEKAIERGVEHECDAIQIFHQNPRMWRPTNYGSDDFAAFNEAMSDSRVEEVAIHAVYLINTASRDPEIREKSLASLIHALSVGDAIGSVGVVLHAGSRKTDPAEEAIARAGETILEALAETESCPVLLENTAGTTGPLGRDLAELEALIDAAGAGERLGVCLDCCHLLASGIEIRTPEPVAELIDDLDRRIGIERLRCLHVNDSMVPLGANRDRHANLGEGEIGAEGIGNFLAEPRFEGLPALIETPGPDGKGADAAEVNRARRMRDDALSRR